MLNAYNEGICFQLCRRKNVGLPTFKLPASTKNMLRLTR